MADGPYTCKRPATSSIAVRLPDGSNIHSSHTALLNIPLLPTAACRAHIFPSLSFGSLISIGLLCDHGCQAIFTATTVTIQKRDTTILTGTRSPSTGLWCLHLPPSSSNAEPTTESDSTPIYRANSAIANDTISKRVAFYHASMFSPTITTWCHAIDQGCMTTWPELTSAQVRKHLPTSSPLIKGHLDQQRANQRPTQPLNLPAPITPIATEEESPA
jgi:hypothetical protein